MSPTGNNSDIVQALDSIQRAFSQTKADKITVSHQADTTNSTVTDAKIMIGVGRILGNGTVDITETVTFPSAFNSPPVVLVTASGFITVGGTYSPTSTDTSWSRFGGAAIRPTTTAVTIRLTRYDGGSFTSGSDYYYQWIAIGN